MEITECLLVLQQRSMVGLGVNQELCSFLLANRTGEWVALELPAARLYEARKTTKRRLEIELANE